jgi:hypothetical protein
MKKNLIIPFIQLLMFSCSAISFAGFSKNSPSVVAQSMGCAFVAKADDASALFINPAGVIQLSRPQVSFMYGIPYMGLPDVSLQEEYLAAAVPLGSMPVVISFGGSSMNAAGQLLEQEGIIGCAVAINSQLAFGANITYLYHNYNVAADNPAASDPVFANGTSKGAVGFDAGALWVINEYLATGISIRHANSPDVGLASTDKVPMEIRGGGAVLVDGFQVVGDFKLRDAGNGVADRQRVTWGLGTEKALIEGDAKTGKIFSRLVGRAGIGTDQVTAGFGLVFSQIGIDYAFAFINNLSNDNSGSHRISLSYTF